MADFRCLHKVESPPVSEFGNCIRAISNTCHFYKVGGGALYFQAAFRFGMGAGSMRSGEQRACSGGGELRNGRPEIVKRKDWND